MSIAAVVRHGRSALAATSGSPTVALTGPADSTGPSGAAAVDPARDQKRLIRNLAIAGVASCAAILASVGSVFAAPVRVPFSFETFSPCTGELVQVEGSRLAFSPAGSNSRSVLIVEGTGTSASGTTYTYHSAAHATTNSDGSAADGSTFTSQTQFIATGEPSSDEDFIVHFVFHFTVAPDGTEVISVVRQEAVCN